MAMKIHIGVSIKARRLILSRLPTCREGRPRENSLRCLPECYPGAEHALVSSHIIDAGASVNASDRTKATALGMAVCATNDVTNASDGDSTRERTPADGNVGDDVCLRKHCAVGAHCTVPLFL